MTVLSLIALVLLTVVVVLERFAFAVLLFLLTGWAWTASQAIRAEMARQWAVVTGKVRLYRTAFAHWWAMRALRGQLAGGATP